MEKTPNDKQKNDRKTGETQQREVSTAAPKNKIGRDEKKKETETNTNFRRATEPSLCQLR